MMRSCEIRAMYMRMIKNIEDDVACMHMLIADERIDPRVKVRMLSASVRALNEVQSLYQEMTEVIAQSIKN